MSTMCSCDPASLFLLVTPPCLVLCSPDPRVLSSLYIVLFSSCAIETVTNLLLYIPVLPCHLVSVLQFCSSISGFATVRTLLLLLCALLPIFVLFSDLSKIFTSADQHSAQTTHFLEKKDSLPPTASSLHSGDR